MFNRKTSQIKSYVMKTIFKVFTLTFFALLFFTSCQNEILEETPITNEEELIAPNSTLSNLLFSTAARDGSVDNIIDNANCLSINLPVTVIVNGVTITINTLEDLELIEHIFSEFENDEDVLELLFPITIVLNDHEEIVINNQDELEAFIEDCEDETDDDIECIDFQYPISFSIYNTDFQVIETVIVENDMQLHEFLERVEDSDAGALLVSLNFPVVMVYANGETITVNNNQELQTALNDAREDCSEEEACREEVVDMYLQECYWNIVAYNDSNDFAQYDLYFKEDHLFKVIDNGTIIATGRWQTTLTDAGVVLSISELSGLEDLVGGDWLVVECDDDRFELVQENTGTNEVRHVVIEQECEDDFECSALEVRMFLNQCQWFAGSNLFDGVPAGTFFFNDDHELVVINLETDEEVIGFWDVELTDEGIILVIDLPSPYNTISLRWKITECAEHRVKMINEDNYLVFESDCNTSNPFECYSNLEYGICDEGDVFDGIATFNLNEIYPDCNEDNVEVTFHSTEDEAHNNVNHLSTEYTNTTNSQTIYVRVTLAGTTEYELFIVTLYVEDCSTTNGCTEEELDSYLMESECYWVAVSVDGSNAFDDFAIQFNSNQDLLIEGGGANYFGTWSTSGNPNDGIILEISQLENNFSVFNGEWLVVECGAERIVLVAGDNEIVIERECP